MLMLQAVNTGLVNYIKVRGKNTLDVLFSVRANIVDGLRVGTVVGLTYGSLMTLYLNELSIYFPQIKVHMAFASSFLLVPLLSHTHGFLVDIGDSCFLLAASMAIGLGTVIAYHIIQNDDYNFYGLHFLTGTSFSLLSGAAVVYHALSRQKI